MPRRIFTTAPRAFVAEALIFGPDEPITGLEGKLEKSLQFPRDLLRFLYWIFFLPVTLRRYLQYVDESINSASALFAHGLQGSPNRRALIWLASFYICLAPWLPGLGLGLALASRGLTVNWLDLTFYMVVGIILSLSFDLAFCVAFLLPFSLAVTVYSSTGFTLACGILVSFALGLAYSLMLKPAKWGLTGGLVYGAVFGLLLDPWSGLMIGAVFLGGYFRIPLYLIEAPLSWLLAHRAAKADAARLWRLQPVLWDELIWFPLPGLDHHLQALTSQNKPAAQDAIASIKGSFRQGRACSPARVREL
jgi:hypothetical protein